MSDKIQIEVDVASALANLDKLSDNLAKVTSVSSQLNQATLERVDQSYKQFSQTLQSVLEQNQKLQEALSRPRRVNIEIGDIDTRLANVRAKIDSIFAQSNGKPILDRLSLEDFTNKINTAKAELKKITGDTASLGSQGVDTTAQQAAIDALRAKLFEAGTQATDFRRRLSDIGREQIQNPLEGFFKSLNQVQSATTQAFNSLGGLGLTASFRTAIGDAAQYQVRLSEIQTISQGLGLSLSELNGIIGGTSDRFGVSNIDAARAAYEGLSNSVIRTRADFSFLNDAASLARVGVTSLENSTNLLSSVINSYGLSAGDARTVSAQLFEAVRVGRFRIEDIANSFGRITPLAAELGIGLPEVGAALAQITLRGVSASEAMTQISATFRDLLAARPGTELGRAIQDVTGFTSGRELVAARGFAGAIRLIGEEGERTGSRIRELLPNVRSLLGFLNLGATRDRGAGFEETARGIANSTQQFEEAERIRNATPGAQFQDQLARIRNQIERDLGQSLLEIFKRVSDGAGGFDNVLRGVTTAFRDLTQLSSTFISAILQIDNVFQSLGTSLGGVVGAFLQYRLAVAGVGLVLNPLRDTIKTIADNLAAKAAAAATANNALNNLSQGTQVATTRGLAFANSLSTIANGVTIGVSAVLALKAAYDLYAESQVRAFSNSEGFTASLQAIETAQREQSRESQRRIEQDRTLFDDAARARARSAAEAVAAINRVTQRGFQSTLDAVNETTRGTRSVLDGILQSANDVLNDSNRTIENARTVAREGRRRIAAEAERAIEDRLKNILDTARNAAVILRGQQRQTVAVSDADRQQLVQQGLQVEQGPVDLRDIEAANQAENLRAQATAIRQTIGELQAEATRLSEIGDAESTGAARRAVDRIRDLNTQLRNLESQATRTIQTRNIERGLAPGQISIFRPEGGQQAQTAEQTLLSLAQERARLQGSTEAAQIARLQVVNSLYQAIVSSGRDISQETQNQLQLANATITSLQSRNNLSQQEQAELARARQVVELLNPTVTPRVNSGPAIQSFDQFLRGIEQRLEQSAQRRAELERPAQQQAQNRQANLQAAAQAVTGFRPVNEQTGTIDPRFLREAARQGGTAEQQARRAGELALQEFNTLRQRLIDQVQATNASPDTVIRLNLELNAQEQALRRQVEAVTARTSAQALGQQSETQRREAAQARNDLENLQRQRSAAFGPLATGITRDIGTLLGEVARVPRVTLGLTGEGREQNQAQAITREEVRTELEGVREASQRLGEARGAEEQQRQFALLQAQLERARTAMQRFIAVSAPVLTEQQRQNPIGEIINNLGRSQDSAGINRALELLTAFQESTPANAAAGLQALQTQLRQLTQQGVRLPGINIDALTQENTQGLRGVLQGAGGIELQILQAQNRLNQATATANTAEQQLEATRRSQATTLGVLTSRTNEAREALQAFIQTGDFTPLLTQTRDLIRDLDQIRNTPATTTPATTTPATTTPATTTPSPFVGPLRGNQVALFNEELAETNNQVQEITDGFRNFGFVAPQAVQQATTAVQVSNAQANNAAANRAASQRVAAASSVELADLSLQSQRLTQLSPNVNSGNLAPTLQLVSSVASNTSAAVVQIQQLATQANTATQNINGTAQAVANLGSQAARVENLATAFASFGVGANFGVESFAEGGVVGGQFNTNGPDNKLAAVRDGEHIMPPRQTEKYFSQLEAMRRDTFPSFAQGGVVNSSTTVGDIIVNFNGKVDSQTGKEITETIRRDFRVRGVR